MAHITINQYLQQVICAVGGVWSGSPAALARTGGLGRVGSPTVPESLAAGGKAKTVEQALRRCFPGTRGCADGR